MKRLSTVLSILLLVSFAHAQQKWERTYGGTGDDYGYSVQQTTDGGYIVAGYNGARDVWLIKTDSSGDTLWTRTYGGTGGDYGWSLQQTSDGGYIIAGLTASFGNGNQVYLVKTDASGDTLWTKAYGGTDSYGKSVQQTLDGGYIVAGYSRSVVGDSFQVYLVKTDSFGDTLWTRTYGGSNNDYGYSVRQTSDGGYIIAGETDSFGAGSSDVYLIKTDASGDTLWTRTYGGTSWDRGYSVQKTSDGGYIITGSTVVAGHGYVWLIKTNASGDTLWTRTYGVGYGYSVRQTSDGGYIIAGFTVGVGVEDVYLIKTNATGDTLWTRTYGGTWYDYGRSVQQTSDGGYIIAGYTDSFGAGGYDVYLIKTDVNGNVGVEEEKGRGQKLEVSIKAIPNPFTSFTTVPGHSSDRFTLYDISGRRVGTYLGNRIGEGLAAGVYFLLAEKGDRKPLRIVKIQ